MNNKVFLLIFIVLSVWFCSKSGEKPSQSSATPSTITSRPSHVLQQDLSLPEKNIETKYVNTNKLNVRNKPDGKIITTLKRGQKITVYENDSNWVRISPDGEPMNWVSSKLLCDTAECNDENWLPQVSQKQSQPQSKPKQESKPRPNYNSDCSCSSGRVCFGPRGGRYCITSGGNKRYGV